MANRLAFRCQLISGRDSAYYSRKNESIVFALLGLSGMYIRIAVFALASLSIQNVFAGCSDDGIVNPQIAIAEEAQTLLQHQEFAKLDQMAEAYRIPGTFDSSGKPKLMGFYLGISNSIANCGDSTEQTEVQWKRHQQLLRDWKRKSPKSDAAALSLALFTESYGWHARGGGYADSVASQGWKTFEARFKNARSQLEHLSAKARDNPAWYEGMLTVGLAQGWSKESFNAMFSEGVKKFPTYYGLYFSKGEFLSPQWYGSEQEFQAFVEESAEATKAQLGETLYARLEGKQASEEKFENGQINYDRLSNGFARISSDFPGAWNENVSAKYSCMAKDYKLLFEQLKKIGSQVAYTAWPSREYYENCKFHAQSECWSKAKDMMAECGSHP